MNAPFRRRFALACFCALAACPLGAHAAAVSLSADPAHIGVGDTVEITVSLDSSAPVNAFSGTLTYPADVFSDPQTSDGDSLVSLWITPPSAAASGRIAFAGATPGGYAGAGGTLFRVFLTARTAGAARVALAGLQVLLNDGSGTPAPVESAPLALTISAAPVASFAEGADAEPPEPFTPALGRDGAVFGGAPYLVFAATDKESGIDHYEVQETRLPFSSGAWRVAASPYPLADRFLTSDVRVKAVDRAGNARVEVFHRRALLRPYEWGIAAGILGASVLIWLFMRLRARRLP